MEIIVPSNFEQALITKTDQIPARLGHVNRVIEAFNNLPVPGITIPASQSVVVAATTTIDTAANYFNNYYSTSALIATTIALSNFPDGGTITWDYLKTTASDLVITFPTGTVISINGSAAVSGLTATLSSGASGRFTITILNIHSVYKVFIVNDVA